MAEMTVLQAINRLKEAGFTTDRSPTHPTDRYVMYGMLGHIGINLSQSPSEWGGDIVITYHKGLKHCGTVQVPDWADAVCILGAQ